jgi:ketosteroid isomerase-like protein
LTIFDTATRPSLGALLLLAGLICPPAQALAQNGGSSGISNAMPSGSVRPEVENIEIAKAYIKALQARDQTTLNTILSPDIIWRQPGNNRFSGAHRGRSNVKALLGAMSDASEGTFRITVADRFASNRDWVGIRIEFAAQRGASAMHQVGFDLVRIKRGRIVEVILFSSDQAQEDNFWGR